ncbi:MAG TPA: asparaginase [Candidatus Limnocylindria bacterium]|nr:asparaginase [Candidatus Limnocylindria bacterium]
MPRTQTPASDAAASSQAAKRPPAARRATATRAPRASRYPRNAAPPVLVEIRRGDAVESRHRGHVVQVDVAGRIERGVGDPDISVSLRSAVKPFALVALIWAGGADAYQLSDAELAVMAASHTGEDAHVRTLQGVLRRSGLSQTLLACGAEGMPLDELTAARLARDGEATGPIRHMCSGFHVASLLLARHAGWTLADYWRPEHPAQQAVAEAVARVFGTTRAALRTAVDACGLQTYFFGLADVARAFALLADPAGAADERRLPLVPALGRVREAMLAAPDMVGGTRDSTDTRLMNAVPGLLVAKSGAEGLRGVGLLRGARGEGTPAAGIAVSIEDGDGHGRANRAVSVEALAQLGVLGPDRLERLAELHRPASRDPRGLEVGQALPVFELAPISELV